LLGLFRTRCGEISGLARLRLHHTSIRGPEPQRIDCKYDAENRSTDKIITFAGYEGHFQPLNGWDEFLHSELRAMTQDRWLRLVDVTEVPIGINVRLGNDFAAARSPGDFYSRGTLKTPLSWYTGCLQLIREQVGFPVRAIVTSDGTENDLEQLLDLGNVIFARPGCAISDLLLMAKSKVLIASGGSSFSAWASFLGQMPTITHPGQSLAWFKFQNHRGYYVGDFDPSSPNLLFLDQVVSVFRSM
jgi:hypothetical protein